MRKTVKNRFAVLMLALTLIITSLSWEPMQVNAAEVPEQQIDSVSDGDENPTEEPAEVPAEESEELLEEETALPEDEPLDLDYILGRPMTEEEIAEQYAIAAQCMEHNGWVKPDMSQRPTRRATGRNVKSGSYTFAASYRNTNLPAVRNQNPYGSCWAFSAIACLEANMIKKGLANTSIDLSERHLIYYGNYSAKDPLGNDGGDSLYFNSSNYTDVLNAGGNNYLSRNALMNWKGAVPESAAPYSAVTTPLNQNDMNLAYGQDTVYMKGWKEIDATYMDQMKAAIMDYGAVSIAYGYYDEYYNPSTAAQYSNLALTPNHAVTVVGWNDNYSRNNFGPGAKPLSDGAWLVRNSWGGSFGDAGYFWLSYEDETIDEYAGVFEAATADSYDHNYQYDHAGGFGYGLVEQAASVFTAKAANGGQEIVKAAAVMVEDYHVSYSLQVYKNPTNASDPTSGIPCLTTPVTGMMDLPGFYTVDLPQEVMVNAGEKFSVVFTLSSFDFGDAYVGCEYPSGGSDPRVSVTGAQAGQSYYMSGGVWYDLGVSGNKNLRVKAFTDDADKPYVGNINCDLKSFDLKQNDKGAYYLIGEIIVVEWVNGVSTVPKAAPTMTFKSTDGKDKIEVFVTPTGTNTYYFDRFIEGLDAGKEYVFEIASGDPKNISPNRSMNVTALTSTYGMPPIKNLGKLKDQKISYYTASNGDMRLYRRTKKYVGNINSELKWASCTSNNIGNFVTGEIVVVEWENGVSTVPFEKPVMRFKSKKGVDMDVFITALGTNTYYFDRCLENLDTTDEFYFTITSGDQMNTSPNKSMIVTTTDMKQKQGTLWETSKQYVKYKTNPNNGQMIIYAVNK